MCLYWWKKLVKYTTKQPNEAREAILVDFYRVNSAANSSVSKTSNKMVLTCVAHEVIHSSQR